MKKLFFIIYYIIFNNLLYSQFIPYEYNVILIYSLEINYSNSTGLYQAWSPDWQYLENAYAQSQARYDRNHSILSKEYFKLRDLNLINTTNHTTLVEYRVARLGWIYNAIKSWDLGNETNTSNIRNYCCEIYSYSSIKNEITLLQSCQKELDRIKYKDPDNYLYSKRYQSIMKTLYKLKNCSASEIAELSWERTELENQTSNNSSNNNFSSYTNQTYFRVPNSSFVYQKNEESIQIDNIIKSTEYTILSFTSFPSKKYTSGWTVCFDKNTYIIQNGTKYYLIKSVGIPICPQRHKFMSINESITYKLFFDKSINLELKFDLIEGVTGGFEFYNISK